MVEGRLRRVVLWRRESARLVHRGSSDGARPRVMCSGMDVIWRRWFRIGLSVNNTRRQFLLVYELKTIGRRCLDVFLGHIRTSASWRRPTSQFTLQTRDFLLQNCIFLLGERILAFFHLVIYTFVGRSLSNATLAKRLQVASNTNASVNLDGEETNTYLSGIAFLGYR